MDDQNSSAKNAGGNILEVFFEILFLLIKLAFDLIGYILSIFSSNKLANVQYEIVLITGAGHGIGREIALQYAKLGCRIACVDIDESANQETVKEANKLNAGQTYGYVCDVTNREKVFELADKVDKEIGFVSILINNAGIMPSQPIDMQTEKEITDAFNVNVFSHFWTIQAFLPQMKDNQGGHIVAICSTVGFIGIANLTAYSATKYAVRGLMESLHDELHDGPYEGLIKVTTIYPHFVNTGLCKFPKIKYPSVLGLMNVRETAENIVKLQRSEAMESSIPKYILPLNNFIRCLPNTCALMIKDFFGSGVDPDEKRV